MSNERLERLESMVSELWKEVEDLKTLLKVKDTKDRPWESNLVGEWMIKVVYPGIYLQKDQPTAGFPQNRRKTAAQIKPGQMMFLYVTSPVKKIIGLTRVTSPMIVKDGRWPFQVGLEWVIGPKREGVTLEECGLEIRPRPGDTLYGITDEIAEGIKELLRSQDDLTKEQWDLLILQYRDTYRSNISHGEAVRRLREAGEHEAADELDDFYATDGTRRGWDEFASQTRFHMKHPRARSIIWPDVYDD